eukprot:g70840.t1
MITHGVISVPDLRQMQEALDPQKPINSTSRTSRRWLWWHRKTDSAVTPHSGQSSHSSQSEASPLAVENVPSLQPTTKSSNMTHVRVLAESCASCGVPLAGKPTFVCEPCGHETYCSRSCQTKHKDQNKGSCTPVRLAKALKILENKNDSDVIFRKNLDAQRSLSKSKKSSKLETAPCVESSVETKTRTIRYGVVSTIVEEVKASTDKAREQDIKVGAEKDDSNKDAVQGRTGSDAIVSDSNNNNNNNNNNNKKNCGSTDQQGSAISMSAQAVRVVIEPVVEGGEGVRTRKRAKQPHKSFLGLQTENDAAVRRIMSSPTSLSATPRSESFDTPERKLSNDSPLLSLVATGLTKTLSRQASKMGGTLLKEFPNPRADDPLRGVLRCSADRTTR